MVIPAQQPIKARYITIMALKTLTSRQEKHLMSVLNKTVYYKSSHSRKGGINTRCPSNKTIIWPFIPAALNEVLALPYTGQNGITVTRCTQTMRSYTDIAMVISLLLTLGWGPTVMDHNTQSEGGRYTQGYTHTLASYRCFSVSDTCSLSLSFLTVQEVNPVKQVVSLTLCTRVK